MVTKRGEIYWVDFEPAQGSEPNKVRPALIVQNDVGNRYAATTIVVPITSRLPAKEYPFMVRLPDDLLPRPSAAVCALMRVVATKRLVEGPLATCDAATMARVDTALCHTLALVR
jgi:mRNA interferase MazF